MATRGERRGTPGFGQVELLAAALAEHKGQRIVVIRSGTEVFFMFATRFCQEPGFGRVRARRVNAESQLSRRFQAGAHRPRFVFPWERRVRRRGRQVGRLLRRREHHRFPDHGPQQRVPGGPMQAPLGADRRSPLSLHLVQPPY